MFSAKVSAILSLFCCILCGAVITLLRVTAAPLLLVFGACFLCVLVLVFSARFLYAGKGRYQEEQPARTPLREYPLILAALCFLGVVWLRLPQFIADGMILSLLLAAAPLLAALACILRFICGEDHPMSGPLALLPIFFLCIHLMNFYRANSKHPHVETYGYEIIVFSLLLLGLYLTSSSKYKLRSPILQRVYAMIPLSAVFMELLMLQAAPALLYRAEDLNTATLLGMSGAAALLITPLFRPIQPVALPAPAEPDADDASTQESHQAE